MLLLIIKTFQEQRNGINFAYNEGVEIKLGGGGGGVEFFNGNRNFQKIAKLTPAPTIKHKRVRKNNILTTQQHLGFLLL